MKFENITTFCECSERWILLSERSQEIAFIFIIEYVIASTSGARGLTYLFACWFRPHPKLKKLN